MSISRKSFFLLSFIVISNMCLATSTSVKHVIEYNYLDNNFAKQNTHVTDTAEKFVLKSTAISYPSHLNVEQVYHDAEGFHVICNGQTHDIEHGYVDNIIRNMANQQLACFQEMGRIQICESAEGLLSLKAYVLLRGGGPIAAKIFYWFVKALGYGIPAAAAVTGVASALAPITAKGGLIGAMGGMSTAAGEVAIGTGVNALMGGGSVATGGAAIAGGAVIGALGAKGTSLVAGAAYVGSGCGSSSSYIAFVETSAAVAGAAGLACWFLP